VESHPQQIQQSEVLTAAEQLAARTLSGLATDCRPTKIMTGTTNRGPAFLYVCEHCGDLSVISIPAGGLRHHDPDDPTSRTRLVTFMLHAVTVEIAALIEPDGTTRATLALTTIGRGEPDWVITAERPAAVGEAVQVLRGLPAWAACGYPVPIQAAPPADRPPAD
jgi:hypothetical protein